MEVKYRGLVASGRKRLGGSMHRSRRFLSTCALLSLALIPGWGQRASDAATGGTHVPVNVEIHVLTDHNRSVPVVAKVQLVADTSETFEAYTNSDGVARFTLTTKGSFQIQVSGPGIEMIHSEIFQLSPWDRYHAQEIRVRLDDDTAPRPTEPATGAVTSTTDLRVPEGARKEFNKGVELLKKHDWVPAQKHFQAAIDRYPSFDSAYDTLGLAKQNTGDYAGAKAAYSKALEVNRNNPNAQRDLAGILMLERNWASAVDLLNKSLALDPKNAGTLTMLAGALLEMGRPDDAIVTAKRVHALEHKSYPAVHLIMAKAFEEKGDKNAAVEEYRVYLAEAPADPNSAAAKSNIERLTAAGR